MDELQRLTRQVRAGQTPAPSAPPPRRAGWTGGIGALLVAAGLFFAKFKSLLFLLLNLKWIAALLKIGLSGGSFLASVWLYALFWGWKYGLLFTLLILVHELGHVLFARIYGRPASLPFFIPGFGAFVTHSAAATPVQNGYIALAGPLVGGLGALAAYSYGLASGDRLFIAAAYSGFLLNLFNLAPVGFLDGGKIAAAISPRIFVFGMIAFVVGIVAFHFWNPLVLLLIAFSIPQAVAAWQGSDDPQYATLKPVERGGLALAYFALAGFFAIAMLNTHVPTPA